LLQFDTVGIRAVKNVVENDVSPDLIGEVVYSMRNNETSASGSPIVVFIAAIYIIPTVKIILDGWSWELLWLLFLVPFILFGLFSAAEGVLRLIERSTELAGTITRRLSEVLVSRPHNYDG